MMDTVNKLVVAGAVLGGTAGIFLLGQGLGTSPSLEAVVPGLLSLAFAGLGVWGGVRAAADSKKGLRALIGAAIGGLLAADILFIPAALALLVAAFLAWQKGK